MQSVQLFVFSFRLLKTNCFILQELLLLESAKTLAANVYEAFSQPTSWVDISKKNVYNFFFYGDIHANVYWFHM